jgi:DNA-binding XRE family transcriptional regulator
MQDGDSRQAGRAELGRRLRRLREAKGWTQEDLATKVKYNRTCIGKIENGQLPLPADRAKDLDLVFKTGSELVEWQARVEAVGAEGEEDPTDRRQFVELGGLSALALTDEQELAAGGPDAATLDEIDSDVDEIAEAYGSAPHAELLPVVAHRWRQLRGMLGGYVRPTIRPRIVELRGQYSYFLGRMAFNANDMRSARRFARLAARYADEAGEPVLVLSVAALRSSIAYWTGRYEAALAALHAVDDVHHPYMNARTAAYEARSQAKVGDHRAARTALDRMERAAYARAPMPGSTPLGPAGVAMFRADVALVIGDVSAAREWAPLAVDGYRRRNGDYNIEEAQHATLAVAYALLLGPSPEPEEAARLARSVLGAGQHGGLAEPTHTVAAKVRQIVDVFDVDHRRLPEVATYTDACRALPPGPSTW